MIAPHLRDDAFLADVEAAPASPSLLHAWWLGQSGFLIAWNGRRVLLDPYLSDSLTKKYANTDKPHVRMTACVVDPARLCGIELAASSHNHTDHLDAETLNPLRAANPAMRLVIPEANRAFVAQRLGCDPAWPIGLDDGGAAEFDGVAIEALPAAHEQIDRDAAGRCHYLGYVLRLGPFALYHSGDTLAYGGLAERLRPHALDIAFLPINGRKPDRRVAGNMTGPEAAALAHAAGARRVIPHHYDMFEFNTESPAAFEAACAALRQPFTTLRNGERLTLSLAASP